MFEVVILIPVADNNGVAFTEAHDAEFEQFVVGLFGGYSWRGERPGGWIDGGKIYRDVSREFVIAVRRLAEGFRVHRVAIKAKCHYRQLAIYVSYLGQAEII